jgi:ATP-dependent DNA helicase RecG
VTIDELRKLISEIRYFGTTEEERTPHGARFIDNRRFEGSITEMIDEAATYIMSAMRKSSMIEGMFRRDITEYPMESLRESIANAVAHRDYSPYVRGSYIQIRMFADRLEVQSPGGLFGNVTIDNLEDEHSTRNARMMRMMEDMQVDEEKIISYIVKHGSINNSQCRKLLNVNNDRAYYLLRKLSEKGNVKTQKRGKGRRYVMP